MDFGRMNATSEENIHFFFQRMDEPEIVDKPPEFWWNVDEVGTQMSVGGNHMDNHSHQTPSYKLKTSPPLLGEGKIPPPELSDNIEILESKWASHGQLVAFRKTATKIAEDYLEDQGIKLVNRPARSNAIRDSGAYKQGREDSRKIDHRILRPCYYLSTWETSQNGLLACGSHLRRQVRR
ncbi:Ankyrin repeat protein [Apiospora saccharicola]|uniref:Ankyrin repeat protein n=1 Tax=Apiospora saccharicola TaxID=335842 RepID=A0ABR1VZW6_9PEZI